MEATRFIGLAVTTDACALGFIAIAEEAIDFPFGLADTEETTIFSLDAGSVEDGELRIADFPIGSADAEKTTVFSLDGRSVEDKESRVGSIGMSI